ncbi:hypothetical protein QBC44DRAFT_14689 [Cladorrhinum sp. PSN332]|nr:hypothetical protein QBC44DRAFT_14689 [Cladorrhinum sp. PSN332]
MKATWLTSLLSSSSLFTRDDPPPPPGPIPLRLPCSKEICHSIQSLPPRFFPTSNSERYKTSYGPLPLAANNETTHETSASSFFFNSAPPCADCFLTNAQVGLEHNGTDNSGKSLRHLVIGNLERDSVTCPLESEPVVLGGTEVPLSLNGTSKTGYYLSKTALLVFSGEVFLSSMERGKREEVVVVLTVDWEWVPASGAEGFKKLTPVWLDIDGTCSLRNSEVPVSREEPEASLKIEPAWKAGFGGKVVWAGGHLVDGGDTLEVTKNGTVVCEMRAGYEHDGAEFKKEHLSSLGSCDSVGRMEVGDEWGLTANYNFTKHAPMEERSGNPAPVMGVSLMYVVRDEES